MEGRRLAKLTNPD